MALISNLDTALVSQTARHVDGVAETQRASVTSLASFNREANVLAYVANDVVSESNSIAGAIHFPLCAKANGGAGTIHSVDVVYADTKIANLELFIFSQEPTNFVDGAPLALVAADVRDLVGIVELPDTGKINVATNIEVYTPTSQRPLPFVCNTASRSLFGLLVTRSAFTPANAAKILIRLGMEVD